MHNFNLCEKIMDVHRLMKIKLLQKSQLLSLKKKKIEAIFVSLNPDKS